MTTYRLRKLVVAFGIAGITRLFEFGTIKGPALSFLLILTVLTILDIVVTGDQR